MMEGLQKIMLAAERLSLPQLREFDGWLQERITDLEAGREPAPVPRGGSQPVEERQCGGVIYRLLTVVCGTPGCKCSYGEGHGPYWFAYWSEQGRTKSKYIGKNFVEISQDKQPILAEIDPTDEI